MKHARLLSILLLNLLLTEIMYCSPNTSRKYESASFKQISDNIAKEYAQKPNHHKDIVDDQFATNTANAKTKNNKVINQASQNNKTPFKKKLIPGQSGWDWDR